MADYRSRFSGPEIDEAVARMFQFDINTNGCIKLKSSENDPYNLDYLQSIGNYVVYYFTNGSAAMQTVSPLRIYVGYVNGVLAQLATILDSVQYREYIDDVWTEWETWYSTGYIYVQSEPPESPQKDCLWIDTSDEENPTMKIYNYTTQLWTEVRPSDTMDVSIYDPTHVKKNIYEYIEELIDNFNMDEDGNKFSDLYAYHVADTTIHFKRQEKADFLDRPTRTEVQDTVNATADAIEAVVDQKIASNIDTITEIVDQLNNDAGTMLTHYNDTTVHTNAGEKTYWDSKAEGDHTHILDDRVRISAQNVVEGVFRVDQLPANIYEICVQVANDAERFTLKVAPEDGDSETQKYVQNGDTVYVQETLTFYFVTNDEQLHNEAGYTTYSALLPETIEWTRIMNTPYTRDGYRLTDVPTYDEMYEIMEYNDTTTVEYITSVFARCASIPNIKGYLNMPNDLYAVHSFERLGDAILYMTVTNLNLELHYFNMHGIPNAMEEPYQDITGTIIYTNTVEDTTYNGMSVDAIFCPAYAKYATITLRSDEATVGSAVPSDVLGSGLVYAYNELTHAFYIIDRVYENGTLVSGTYEETNYITDIYTVWYKGILYCYGNYGGLFETKTPITTDYSLDTYKNLFCEPQVFMWGDQIVENVRTYAKESVLIHSRYHMGIYNINPDTPYVLTGTHASSGFLNADAYTSLSEDYIILQTMVEGTYLYVLAYEAIDQTSAIDETWKAYTINIVLIRFDITKNDFKTYKKFIVKELEGLHEVGTTVHSDYTDSLDAIYQDYIHRSPDSPRPVKMEISNDAFVIYNEDKPLYSILLTAWSDMYTSMVDTTDNSIKKETIYGTQVFNSNTANPYCPSSLCLKFDGKPYVSYDGYNFYYLEDETIYAGRDNEVTIMKNIGIDQSESMLAKIDGDAFEKHAYVIIFGQTTIDNAVNEVIGDIADKIKEDTGSLSSNVLYSQFDEIIDTPVNITGENNQLINIHIAKYDKADPTYYYCYNMTGNSTIAMTETVTGGPLTYDHFYIKGGYYQNAQYAWVLFTHDDGSIPEIGFALISSMSVSVLSYTKIASFEPLTQLQRTQIMNGMSFKTFKDDTVLTGYMEFSMNNIVTGITTLSNYPILRADYQTGQISVTYLTFTDVFTTNSQPLAVMRMYRFNDRVYLVRANNSIYSLSIFGESDYTLTNGYKYGYTTITDMMLNPSSIRNLPEPFLTNHNFTIAFTDKSGYLDYVIADTDANFSTIVSASSITTMNGTDQLQYNAWYDNNTDSLLLVNIGYYNSREGFVYQTSEILIYLMADQSELESGGGIIYQGKIAESILKGYAVDNQPFKFPEILPIYSNYNYALMCASWFEPLTDAPYNGATPVIQISRDTGPETLRRVYDLTTVYIKKLNEYQDKFEKLQDQVSNCAEYADLILELIG